MPTSAVAGYKAKVYSSTDGSTYTEVGELRDVTLNIKSEAADATSHSSAGWKEVVPTINSWSASFGALFVGADAAQDTIKSAILNRTLLYFRFDPAGTSSGLERFSGTGYITSYDIASPTNDLTTISGSIEGTGALTNANQ